MSSIGKQVYNYKYNGKELQDELGLNMYDYGARNYEPSLGRWMNIDPLAEKYQKWSPYNYCIDNPVYFIDPDGMATTGSDWSNRDQMGRPRTDYRGIYITPSDRGDTSTDAFGGWNYNLGDIDYTDNPNPNEDDGRPNLIKRIWASLFGASESSVVAGEGTWALLDDVKEVNAGLSFNGKIGGFSLSFGPEIAVGETEYYSLNVASRFKGSISFDMMKFLSFKDWKESKVEAKVSVGWKVSSEATLKSGYGTSSNVFTKTDVSFLGSGGEFKISSPVSGRNVQSYNFGYKVGIEPKIGLNQTAGVESQFVGSALITDRSYD